MGLDPELVVALSGDPLCAVRGCNQIRGITNYRDEKIWNSEHARVCDEHALAFNAGEDYALRAQAGEILTGEDLNTLADLVVDLVAVQLPDTIGRHGSSARVITLVGTTRGPNPEPRRVVVLVDGLLSDRFANLATGQQPT